MPKFQKGQSGNPGGKPKGAVGIAKRALDALLKEIATDPEYQESLRLRAIRGDATLDKMIADRTMGAVPKVMQIETPAPLVIDTVDGDS